MSLALDPLELVVIVGALLTFLLWGPNKIPELARALGRARSEYNKAASEIEKLAKESMKPVEATDPSTSDMIIEVAHQLGIVTEGKTREEIADEIVAKKSV
jgi:sec-independent protein translocase protein TatA